MMAGNVTTTLQDAAADQSTADDARFTSRTHINTHVRGVFTFFHKHTKSRYKTKITMSDQINNNNNLHNNNDSTASALIPPINVTNGDDGLDYFRSFGKPDGGATFGEGNNTGMFSD